MTLMFMHSRLMLPPLHVIANSYPVYGLLLCTNLPLETCCTDHHSPLSTTAAHYSLLLSTSWMIMFLVNFSKFLEPCINLLFPSGLLNSPLSLVSTVNFASTVSITNFNKHCGKSHYLQSMTGTWHSVIIEYW